MLNYTALFKKSNKDMLNYTVLFKKAIKIGLEPNKNYDIISYMTKVILNKYKVVALLFFAVYLIMLFKFLFLKFPFHEIIMAILTDRQGIAFSVNLMPLKTIFYYLGGDPTLKIAIKNLIGNIIIFLPFGFLLPLLLKQSNAFKIILFSSLVFSLFIETAQFILRIGSFDVDDLLLNTAGGILGYAILRITKLEETIALSGD